MGQTGDFIRYNVTIESGEMAEMDFEKPKISVVERNNLLWQR